MPSRGTIPVVLHPKRYLVVLGLLGLVHVIFFLLAVLPFWVISIRLVSFASWLPLVFLVYYDFDAIKRVELGKVAGIQALSRPAIELRDSGFAFVPRWLTELDKLPRAQQEDQFPSDPENIARKPEDRTLHPAMFDPIRVTTGGPPEGGDDSDMLDVRLTFEPEVTVIWQVEDIGFFDFFINIDGETWPEKRAFLLKQLRDTAEAVLMIEFAKYTASQILTKLEEISDTLQKALSQKVSDWGVNICSVSLQNITPDHATNTAMGLVPQARAKRMEALHIAEGDKQAAVLRAEGNKEAAVIEAKGRKEAIVLVADGQHAAAELLGMAGSDYIAADVAREVVGKATTILGTEPLVTSIAKLIKGQPLKEGA